MEITGDIRDCGYVCMAARKLGMSIIKHDDHEKGIAYQFYDPIAGAKIGGIFHQDPAVALKQNCEVLINHISIKK